MAKEFDASIKNERQVKQFFNSGLTDIQRFAISGTANGVAFLGMERSEEQFRKEFHLSNSFLIGSGPGKGVLKFNRAIPSHDINKIESSWGVPEKRGANDLSFMEDQETGFQHKGMVPTKHAYPGGNKNKVIKRAARRHGIQIRGTRGFPRGIAKTNSSRTIWAIRRLYLEGFGRPNSGQFIYIRKEDQFPTPGNAFSEGMYQFASGSINDPSLQFPKLRMIYAKDDSVGKKRKMTNWMEKSANSISQRDIETIFEKEFNKSFTRAVQKHF